jgi:hypothetical protein
MVYSAINYISYMVLVQGKKKTVLSISIKSLNKFHFQSFEKKMFNYSRIMFHHLKQLNFSGVQQTALMTRRNPRQSPTLHIWNNKLNLYGKSLLTYSKAQEPFEQPWRPSNGVS